LKQIEQERDNAIAEARVAKKEIDPAFKAKFQESFNEAAFTAEDLITQMDITDSTTGAIRKGTKQDVDYLFSIESPTKRNAEIRTMFGDDAITIIPKIDAMKGIQSSYNRALAQEKAKAAELEKQEAGQRVQMKAETDKALAQISNDLVERIAEYRDAPDDKEAADLRQRGYNIFDSPATTPQQRIVKLAHVRHMVAAHYPMKLQNTRLRAEVDTLKAELAQLKESDPNKPTRRSAGGGAAPSGEGLSWEEEARKTLA
jgi:hypothetical protein